MSRPEEIYHDTGPRVSVHDRYYCTVNIAIAPSRPIRQGRVGWDNSTFKKLNYIDRSSLCTVHTPTPAPSLTTSALCVKGGRGIEVHGKTKRRRGRRKRRWLDGVRDDIRENTLSGEEVYDRATETYIVIQ